jgi:grpE
MKYNPFKKGKKMTEQTQTPEAENPNTAAQIEERAENTPPTLESLQARIAELEGQLKDEQLRSLANEQNLRRRFQDEIQAAHKFAAQKFAAEMLTVKDYLEMALQDQSGNFEALKMGVSMTLNELNKAFDHTQIKEIPAEQGSKLDPHHHQAMQEVEASEQEAGTIVGTLKKGYTLNERVLRPAMVTVAKAA